MIIPADLPTFLDELKRDRHLINHARPIVRACLECKHTPGVIYPTLVLSYQIGTPQSGEVVECRIFLCEVWNHNEGTKKQCDLMQEEIMKSVSRACNELNLELRPGTRVTEVPNASA